MIDQRIVGAIVRGDLTGYALTADDARLIVRQRVATPVASLLQDFPDAASEEAHAILKTASDKAALSSLLLARTANDVSRILNDADIPALIYKGVAVAAMNQGTWRGRESVDVDVLVAPDRVDDVHDAFVAAGLERYRHRADPPGPFFRFHSFENAYTGLARTVDLHWRVDSQHQLDIPFDTMWQGRQRILSRGVEVWTPSTAVSILLSAIHGCKEFWYTLRHMLDFASSVSGLSPQTWAEVEEAAKFGAAKPLAVALGIAEACETPSLPATAGPWAQRIAGDYTRDWTPQKGNPLVWAKGPGNALRRLGLRAQMAPGLGAVLDGWLRFSLMVTSHKVRTLTGRDRSHHTSG